VGASHTGEVAGAAGVTGVFFFASDALALGEEPLVTSLLVEAPESAGAAHAARKASEPKAKKKRITYTCARIGPSWKSRSAGLRAG
jgi:hypothetical protein